MGDSVAEGSAEPPTGKKKMGRPPSSDSRRTRNQLLHSAREVFSEQGYEKATFKEIAERTGLTRPAIHRYFPNKEALYLALIDSAQTGLLEVAISEAEAHDDLTTRLSSFLGRASQVEAADRSYARFIATTMLDGFRNPALAPRTHHQFDSMRNFVSEALEQAVAQGRLDADTEVSAMTEMLIAIMWGLGLYVSFLGSHENLDGIVVQFNKLLKNGLE